MRKLEVALGLGRFSKIPRGSLRPLRWRGPQGSKSLGGLKLGNSNLRFSSDCCALLGGYLSREGNGRENSHILSAVVTYVAGDHDSKNHEITGGDFGAPHCSYFFSCSCSYSYSYSLRSSIAIQPIGPQVTANRFDQRSVSPQFQQPSSTSTVRRGGLSTASLSTKTRKSDARRERIPTECITRVA
jgi:hypothetical protein